MGLNPLWPVLAILGVALVAVLSLFGQPSSGAPAAPAGAAPTATSLVYQVVLVAQPTATPKAPPPPGPAATAGQRFSTGGLTFEVRAPRLVAFSTLGLAEQGSRSVLVFEVLQENYRQDRRSRIGPEMFFVRDGDDFEYRAQQQPLDPVRGLKSGELGFGERVRGEVYVVVPTVAKGFTLYFYVSLSADPADYQTVRVSLGL